MRIVIFDGIMETHLASSLERALIALGHEVLNTGKITHGFSFIESKVDTFRVNTAIDVSLSFHPDLVLVFRPAGLPPQLLKRLRKSNAILAAWFSDDPVLWKLSYGHVVKSYDFVLHCGDERVLRFYEHRHGISTGVNFPFWTDGYAFPYVYEKNLAESDALFLGNVSDKVRRNRYFTLGRLKVSLRAHGKIGEDYFKISGGYLDADAEVIDAGSRTRIAINIPQFFSDHVGLQTGFDHIGDLGSFQYPSRVIQYAAMGIPIISLVPQGGSFETFPELVIVRSEEELDEKSRELLASGSLSSLSERTYQRFARHFSAGARALAIESLVVDDSWRSQTAAERAEWFTRFDGSQSELPITQWKQPASMVSTLHSDAPTDPEVEEVDPLRVRLEDYLQNPPRPGRKLTIALVATGWGDHVSPARIASRALIGLGHVVREVNPFIVKHLISNDPMNDFTGVVDVVGVYEESIVKPDVFIFVDDKYVPDPIGVRLLKKVYSVKFIAHALSSNEFSRKMGIILSQMDYVTCLNKGIPDVCASEGLDNVEYMPDLVDRAYLGLFHRQKLRNERVVLLAQRSGHIQLNQNTIDDFSSVNYLKFCVDSDVPRQHGLASVARALFSSIVFVLPDYSRSGTLPNRLLGHAFFSGGITVVIRSNITMTPARAGIDCLAVDKPGEAALKFRRLLLNPTEMNAMRLSAFDLAKKHYGAEERLQQIFDLFL